MPEDQMWRPLGECAEIVGLFADVPAPRLERFTLVDCEPTADGFGSRPQWLGEVVLETFIHGVARHDTWLDDVSVVGAAGGRIELTGRVGEQRHQRPGDEIPPGEGFRLGPDYDTTLVRCRSVEGVFRHRPELDTPPVTLIGFRPEPWFLEKMTGPAPQHHLAGRTRQEARLSIADQDEASRDDAARDNARQDDAARDSAGQDSTDRGKANGKAGRDGDRDGCGDADRDAADRDGTDGGLVSDGLRLAATIEARAADGRRIDTLVSGIFADVRTVRASALGDGLFDVGLGVGAYETIPTAARPLWDTWLAAAPTETGMWRALDPRLRHEWLRLALGSRRSGGEDRPAGATYHLDGRQVTDLDGFYCAIGEAVNGPGGYFGWNLDALDDCLCGGFGASTPFTLVWGDAEIARRAFGAEEFGKLVALLTERDRVTVVLT
ncbi:barstar family protein [Actinoplanes sp. G11-F43]|uniref:barstar family protein n=1 Tax=Actinoplanes sp. G11-F43 TaxID=3424130 RepID=UPI003D3390B9